MAMASSGSDVLTFANWGLSLLDYALIIALVVALRLRLKSETGTPTIPIERGRVHAIVGTVTLVFIGFLGLVTATGPMFRVFAINGGIMLTVQVLAVGARAGIFILLLAWILYTLESNLRGRWPRADAVIEKVLNLGL
jgi:hypothetical protein